MNLTIDIGNTRTKVAFFSQHELVDTATFEQLSEQDILRFKAKYHELNKVILVAVKQVSQKLIDCLQHNFDHFIQLTHNTPVPVENRYQTPETLGLDRLSAVVGATTLFPLSDILVIDAGTAITFDLIDAQNTYLGGNISPGMQMRFDALHQFAGKLPLVKPGDPSSFLGTATTDAIRSGVVEGMIFEIQGYINSLKESYHNLQVVITGGDAIFFAKKLKKSIFVNLNLISYGLNRILEHNAI